MAGPISRRGWTSSRWRFAGCLRSKIGIPILTSRSSIRKTRTCNFGSTKVSIKHSLGGALAQIAGAVLGSDQVAACYTYGSPRVGNFYFDPWVKVPSYRVMNYADIVPQVPLPIAYRHSGDPRYM